MVTGARAGWPPIGPHVVRLRRAAKLTQEQLAENASVSVDLIKRLEQGNRMSARIASLHAIAQALGVPLSALLEEGPRAMPNDEFQRDLGRSQGTVARRTRTTSDITPVQNGGAVSSSAAERRQLEAVGVSEDHDLTGARPSNERAQLIASAENSMRHAVATESATVGHVALEHLEDEVVRLARAYPSAPPLALVGDMTLLRDRVYGLLERTRRPGQIATMYFTAGQLCGLLASASFDLGHPDVAAEHAYAVRAYAEAIGHRELCAWADGMLATCAFWSGRTLTAVKLTERGLASSPEGAPRVGLHCIGARAFALMNDVDGTRASIRAADQARERADGRSELHDHVGGQFAFNEARQAFSNGSALLRIGELRAASKQCETAIELYAHEPGSRRGYAARVDLAAARLLLGDLDGSAEALQPVWSIPPSKRVANIVVRLKGVRETLASRPYQGSRQAARVSEHIAGFVAETALRALPPHRQ